MAGCKHTARMNVNVFRTQMSRIRKRKANVPKSSTLTYDGLINENSFQLSKNHIDRNKLVSIDHSHCRIINPLDQKSKEIWQSLLLQTKFDGIGARLKPIDLIVILDVSGSMNSNLGMSSDTCLSLAKNAIRRIKQILTFNDRIGLCIFNENATKIFYLKNPNRIKDFEDKLEKIYCGGGTDLKKAIKLGFNMIRGKQYPNSEKKVLLLTDMNDDPGEEFLKLINDAFVYDNIFTVILGIGCDLNCDLVDVVSKIKGCSIYPATEEEHIVKFISQFEYIFFPVAFNAILEFKSNDLSVVKTIGTRFKITEVSEKPVEWKLSNHNLNDSLFKSKINFLLLYFNRINKKLPKPLISKISDFIRYNKKTLAEINTISPSVTVVDNLRNLYVEGGLILLKLRDNEVSDNLIKRGSIILKYYDTKGKLYEESFHFSINFSEFKYDNCNYFNGQHIRRGMCLYFYAKFLRRLMKIENSEKCAYGQEFLKENRLKLVKKNLVNFINTNENDNKLKKEVNKQIEKLYTKVVLRDKKVRKKEKREKNNCKSSIQTRSKTKKQRKVCSKSNLSINNLNKRRELTNNKKSYFLR